MFNFQNMNDYEFELLCKDILEIKLERQLRTYGKGKDGGIDISCFVMDNTKNVIVQAKHYLNTRYSILFSSLKKELDKVKVLAPKNYYLCTTLRLTPQNITDIYNLFKEFMDSFENIYDGTRIDDFLKDHIDIVNKHYKLWLTSSNVLELINNKDIFIDTEELMFDIEKETNLFVETKSYFESIEVLEKENIIIISGDPGVGKTTISKMLLLNYSNKGFCVRYASDNSIKDLKKVLSKDISKKEIILMDDFLGQHYLNLRDERPSEIKTLISYILRNNNKKLILNSRITILNEALRRSFKFKDFLADNEIKRYLIDLNTISVSEKAKIFYNHIYFNGLPTEYFNDIKKEKRYINIINHKNYNPRIIEYVTKERNYKTCNGIQYYNYIMNKLENPNDVWEDEFEHKIDSFDRIFMHTLYSLTDTFIEESILKECFNRRIKDEPGYDSTRDMFAECFTRLTESMIRIVEDKGRRKVGVTNPSINDFIFHHLNNNENEIDFILDYSIYIEQSNRISEINEEKTKQFIISKIRNNEFLSMKTIHEPICYHYIKFILDNKYKDKAITDIVITIITNEKTYYGIRRETTSKFLVEFFSDSEILEFYSSIKDLLFNFNKMKVIFKELVFEDINEFISIYKSFIEEEAENDDWIETLEFTLEEYIIDCISEEVEMLIEEKSQDITNNIISNADRYMIDNYIKGVDEYLLNSVKDAFWSEIDELIEVKRNQIDNELFSIDKLDVSPDSILNQIDIYSLVEDYFNSEPYKDYFRNRSAGLSGYEEVHQIFNREYNL